MEWYDNIENEITINDIPEEYKYLAEKVGIIPFLKLIQEVDGSSIYIPTTDYFLKNFRNRKIQAEYNGYNSKELAKRYYLTQKQINNIVNGK